MTPIRHFDVRPAPYIPPQPTMQEREQAQRESADIREWRPYLWAAFCGAAVIWLVMA